MQDGGPVAQGTLQTILHQMSYKPVSALKALMLGFQSLLTKNQAVVPK